jgi:hypothetical protein
MLQAQQQMLFQAQQAAAGGRPGAGLMGIPGGGMGALPPSAAAAAGMARPGMQQPGLPPGASVNFFQTAQGLLPFLCQPGQAPIQIMPQGGGAGGAQIRPLGAPGMQQPGGMVLQPPFPAQFMPGMQQPRPRQ